MAVIRIGSVGLGGISGGVHIPGIMNSPDLKLVALCDIDEKRLYERAESYGIDKAHCFTDYRELIACPEVDAVDISTPNHMHTLIAGEAVKAGKPYVLEKPVSIDTVSVRNLCSETMKSGVGNMICFSYRYKASARFARELVKSGRLGKIYHVNMQYYQAWGLPDRNASLVWRFVKEYSGSGALGDLGCHALDLCSFVTGEEYLKVVAHEKTYVDTRKLLSGDGFGKVDVDDFSNILAEMKSGASFSFQISRFAYGRGNYQRMEIYGEKGAIVYTLDRIPGVDEIEVADASTDGKFVSLEIPESCRVDQMQSFADIVNGKPDGLSADIRDGLRNQILLDGITESAEKGHWIELK